MGASQFVARLPGVIPIHYMHIETALTETEPPCDMKQATVCCDNRVQMHTRLVVLRPLSAPPSSLTKNLKTQWRNDVVRIDMSTALGKGGFGQVYSGIRESDGVLLAVKLVKLSSRNHLRLVKTVIRLRHLYHPNLVRILDFWSPKLMQCGNYNETIGLSNDCSSRTTSLNSIKNDCQWWKTSSCKNNDIHQLNLAEPSLEDDVQDIDKRHPRASLLTLCAEELLAQAEFTVGYIIEERCLGLNLLCYLRKMFPNVYPPETFARRIITQILRGLQQLHRSNLIHGDLKLENIMFGDAENQIETLKLVDLDCCRPHRPVAHNGMSEICEGGDHHTDAYAAPEVHEGYISPASDMLAVGCICYSIVEGDLPSCHRTDSTSVGVELFGRGRGGSYSKDCLQFMQYLLNPSLAHRCPDANAALAHDWIKTHPDKKNCS